MKVLKEHLAAEIESGSICVLAVSAEDGCEVVGSDGYGVGRVVVCGRDGEEGLVAFWVCVWHGCESGCVVVNARVD